MNLVVHGTAMHNQPAGPPAVPGPRITVLPMACLRLHGALIRPPAQRYPPFPLPLALLVASRVAARAARPQTPA